MEVSNSRGDGESNVWREEKIFAVIKERKRRGQKLGRETDYKTETKKVSRILRTKLGLVKMGE